MLTFAALLRKRPVLFTMSIAELAQLVEQRIRNAWVGGSSPPFGSRWLEMRCAMYDYIVHRILLWGQVVGWQPLYNIM